MGAERGIYRSLRPISVSSSKKREKKGTRPLLNSLNLGIQHVGFKVTGNFLIRIICSNEKRMIREMRGTRELRFDSPPLMFHWH